MLVVLKRLPRQEWEVKMPFTYMTKDEKYIVYPWRSESRPNVHLWGVSEAHSASHLYDATTLREARRWLSHHVEKIEQA